MREQARQFGKVGTGAVMLIVGRATAAVCGLVQVPIVIGALGPEGFGVWVALTGLLWTLVGFDGGLGFAIQNRLARALASDRSGEAAALIRQARSWLVRGAVIGAIVSAALWRWGDWPAWLGVTDSGGETRRAVALVLATAMVSLPFSLATRIAAAVQVMWMTGLWTAVGSIAGLILIVMSAALGLGLEAFVAGACVLAALPPIATALHLRVRFPRLVTPATGVPLPSREIWRESALFLVPQLGAALVTSFIPTLIAFVAGPLAAGGYGVLQRLYGLALQLQTLSLQPTWAAYTHAAARGEATEARRIFRGSMMVTAAVVTLVLLMLPFTRAILDAWLRDNVPPITGPLLWGVAAWHLVQCLGQPAVMVLNGTGHPAVVARSAMLSIALSLGLSFWLGPLWGAVGIVLALAVPHAVVNLPLTGWHARRALRAIGAPASP